MQAITVKYMPATNTKPTRYKAQCGAGSLTVSASHSDEDQEDRAAKLLIAKLQWGDYGDWIKGNIHSGAAVYVCKADKNRDFEILDTRTKTKG